MARRQSEETDRFILERLKSYGVKTVETKGGTPAAPRRYTSAWLDFLDRWAVKVVLSHPEAPAILRDGDRFILDRPERKRTRYTSIRKALRKSIFELSLKEAAEREG